ncbi:MAG: L-fucose isomerase [Oscillospiraceae bacterium]|nr:L-fucose isomerase [Oscillospiraceae bacterium]
MYPVIGIRPVIDGRRKGIRESLEEQTMGMAHIAANLISENLKYSDGTPVKCVIADTTIGGGYEAALCEEKFSKENVTATLTVTPCWCYGTEVLDMNPTTVKGLWGFNGTERPGAVLLAAAMAAYAQNGIPCFAIYGHDVQDAGDTFVPDDVKEKLLRFAKCAVAVGEMKNKAYCNIGAVSMGIAGSYCNVEFFSKYLGLRPEWVDMVEIMRRIDLGIYDHEEYEKALAWKNEKCADGPDIVNQPPMDDERRKKDWEFVVKMTLIVRDIMLGNEKLAEMGWIEESCGRNAILGGFQGQRQWTDYLPNGDFTEAILNSTFDWNGKKKPVLLATENDGLNGVSMLLGTLLTHSAPIFADVRTYWSPDAVERVSGIRPTGTAENGFIHLINSGAAALDGTGMADGMMKPWYDMTDKNIDDCLAATDWRPGNLGYFRGGGFSSHWRNMAEMPVTMIRVNIVAGIGPVLQIAEGTTCVIPDEVHNIIDMRTDPTWPTTYFAPRLTGEGAFKDVYSVMANWGANHGSLTYGHIGADLITLASMLRIPVSMHNVSDDKIYRPHCWSAFGTKDLESADYRACQAYGPLFK